MILDLDRLRMEYAKIYQVDEGSARREPLGGSLSEPSGLIDASFLCLIRITIVPCVDFEGALVTGVDDAHCHGCGVGGD
jgi:hypothetical protein